MFTDPDRLGQHLDRLPLAYIEADANFRVLEWNPAAEKIFGYSKEEALGRMCLELILSYPLDDQIKNVIRGIEAGDMQSHSVNENRTKDGRIITCEWFNTPFMDAAGNFAGVAALAQDITERKHAQQKIALARDFYLKLLDGFPMLIWHSGVTGKCNFFNKTWLEFTGRTHDQEIGDGWTEGVHRKDLGQCLKDYLEAFQERKPFELVYRLRRHDGVYRWIIDHGKPFNDWEGQFAGFIGSCHDITDQKQAMDELRESKEHVQALSHRLLAVREDERKRLANELHDGISQTLTSLALAFEAGMDAAQEFRPARFDEARAWLEKGLQQTRELAYKLRPAMLDYLGLLSGILWLIEHFTKKEKLQIHFRHDGLSARFAPALETVAFRLVEEALANIVQHAKVNEASVRIWVQDGLLNVQIEDEGSGFDHEAARTSTKGVGLAGIREQIELLGGKLVIDSVPGDGTSLLAQLPLTS